MGRNLILQAEYKHKKQPIGVVPAIHSQNKGKFSLPANKLVGSINYFHWIIQFKTKIIERINYFTLKPALNYIDMKFHKQTSGVMCADVAVCIDYHWESLQPQSSQKATFRSLTWLFHAVECDQPFQFWSASAPPCTRSVACQPIHYWYQFVTLAPPHPPQQ